MREQLITRLCRHDGFDLINVENLEQHLAEPGCLLLFCSGDPVQRPESMDLVIILPELRTHFAEAFRVGVVDASAERAVQDRYGITQWPSLVMLRDGEYLGSIARLQDWAVYVQEFSALLGATPSRPPSIGISVVEQGVGHAN